MLICDEQTGDEEGAEYHYKEAFEDHVVVLFELKAESLYRRLGRKAVASQRD